MTIVVETGVVSPAEQGSRRNGFRLTCVAPTWKVVSLSRESGTGKEYLSWRKVFVPTGGRSGIGVTSAGRGGWCSGRSMAGARSGSADHAGRRRRCGGGRGGSFRATVSGGGDYEPRAGRSWRERGPGRSDEGKNPTRPKDWGFWPKRSRPWMRGLASGVPGPALERCAAPSAALPAGIAGPAGISAVRSKIGAGPGAPDAGLSILRGRRVQGRKRSVGSGAVAEDFQGRFAGGEAKMETRRWQGRGKR